MNIHTEQERARIRSYACRMLTEINRKADAELRQSGPCTREYYRLTGQGEVLANILGFIGVSAEEFAACQRPA